MLYVSDMTLYSIRSGILLLALNIRENILRLGLFLEYKIMYRNITL